MTLKRLKSCKTNSERTMKKRHKDAKKKRQNQNNSENNDNGIRIFKLKNKMGTRQLPTAEISMAFMRHISVALPPIISFSSRLNFFPQWGLFGTRE